MPEEPERINEDGYVHAYQFAMGATADRLTDWVKRNWQTFFPPKEPKEEGE